jgi:hypothetical protein
LPAGNPVVTGTTISSTWANNTLSDIATALTQSLAKDGQTTPTANIPLGGFKITGLGAPTTAGDALAFGSSLGAVTATTGTFSGNVQMASQNGGQLAGLRNKIINGDMRVAQYGTTAVNLTSTSQFRADRFSAVSAGTTPPTVSFGYSTDGSVSTSSGRHLYMQVSVAKGTLDAGNTTQILQNIEGLNTADLLYGTASARTITISFRARIQNLASAVIGVSIRNSASDRSYVAPVTITSANTYSVTIPGDTSGTWLTDTGVGLRLAFCIGAGSTFSTATANAWQAGNFVATTTTTNVTGTATAAFSISDVQLEVGPIPTIFEQIPIGLSLQLCQRYFETNITFAFASYALAGANLCASLPFAVVKRATPVTITNITDGSPVANVNVGALSFSAGVAYMLAFRPAVVTGSIQFGDIFSASSEL